MSPDEQAVAGALTAITRRARILVAAEALAWGLAAAAISAIAAPFVAALVLALRIRATRRKALVSAIERVHRDARNVFVTADELLRGVLAAKPFVRQRVFQRAAIEARTVDRRSVVSASKFVTAMVVAGAAWLIVSTAAVWRPVKELARRSISTQTSSVDSSRSGEMHVTVTLTPPAYTGLPAGSTRDPSEVSSVEGTTASVLIDTRAASVTVEHEGITRSLSRDGQGRFVDRVELRKTGFYAIDTETGQRRVIPVVVSPDALPSVRVTVPGRDLAYAAAGQRIDFEVNAADDFGLRALALEYTKVSGSGEQFSFRDGQIPLTLAKSNDREWRGRATQSLAGLELGEGDMLVYRAVATDSRPGDGAARSDAFFIEITRLAAAAGDAFTVPQEETRYALSQQMLIIKTDRLDQQRATMAAGDVREAALNLAVEQRMIRAELVFMLGGAIEDEDVEAEQSSELQAGRLQNRGQGDLRAATIAMSQAEKLLTGASTREALTAERAAVAALQRAFARDRYILRAISSRTALDAARRLTGSLGGATSWRREQPMARPNRRAALLQDLLAGVGALRTNAAAATTLAREALRIDAASPTLRKAAEDLQKLADTWAATPSNARNATIDAIASSVAVEAALALAAPQLPPVFASPSLAGGFAEALRRK